MRGIAGFVRLPLAALKSVLLRVALSVTFLSSVSAAAFAQAWTPAQGEGTVALQFQDAYVKYHQLPTVRRDRGPIYGKTMLVDFTYGISDKAAASVAIPYVASRYGGPFPHPTPTDNGSYHSTFQDFRFDFRYNISRQRFVITPFVGTILPSHGYEYFAHAAVGRHVRELQTGVNFAKLLDRLVPGLFVQGRYSYGFAEKILDISHNRSILDLETGYFVNPAMRVFVLGSGQLTHGGVDLNGNSLVTLGPVLYPHHDQIARENALNLGAGAAYDLSPSFGVFGSFMRSAAGRNTHALQRGLTFGLTWTVMTGEQGARASRMVPRTAADAHGKALGKCICEKGK